MFTKACECAIRAVLYIAIKSINGSRINIDEIAKEIDAPRPFTAKILQTLVREKVVSSIRGLNGGFYLNPKSKPIALSSIVKAIDGSDDALHTCTLGLKECSDRFPCPIHHEIRDYKEHLRKVMKERTIQELSSNLIKGKTFLKNVSHKRSTR